MTGGDLIRQLRGKDLGSRLLVSQNMLRRQEDDFLDDITRKDAEKALGLPVIPVEADGFELWDAICGRAEETTPAVKETEETEYYRYNR